MKHVKLIVALLLFVALLVNVTFAAGPQTARRMPLPMRETDQLVTAQGVKAGAALQVDKSELTRMAKQVSKANVNGSSVVLSKGYVAPEYTTSGLSGTYPIGAAHTFKTIADVAFLMNIGAVTGPTVFELTDAAYTEAGVAIGATTGASAVNTITIRPAAGNTACVITLTDNPSNGGGLVFTDAEYVTIDGTASGEAVGSRNLTIALSATPTTTASYDAPVRLFNVSNFAVVNTIVPGNSAGAAWADLYLAAVSTGNASISLSSDPGKFTSTVTIDNNELYGGHFGVRSLGNFLMDAGSYGAQDDAITVSNNYIHDVTEAGIQLEQVTGAVVSGNVVSRVVFGSSGGASPNLFTDYPFPPSWYGAGPAVGSGLSNFPLIYRVSGITVWGDYTVISKNKVDSVYQNRTSAGTFGAQAFGIRLIGFGNNDPDPAYGGGSSLAGVTSGSMIKNNIVTRVFSKAVQNNGLKWHEVGIKMESGRWDTVVHNTVYFGGAENPTNQGSMVGLLVEGTTFTDDLVFGGSGGFPVWTLGQASNLFSYRMISRNNIFELKRTTTGVINAVMGIQNSTSPLGFVSDYRPPSNNNVLYLGNTGNVVVDSRGNNYASVLAWVTGAPTAGVDGASQANAASLTSESDAHLDAAGYSTADGTGATYSGISDDYDGVARSSPPDIGALEGTSLGLPHDVKPLAMVSPGGAGAPAGLPFSPLEVSVANMSGFAETAVPINIHIVAPDLGFVDFPGTFDIGASAVITVTVPGTWTPAVGGTYTFTVTTSLAGDNYPGNDAIVTSIPVAAQSTVPYTSGFELVGDQAGWFAATQWGLGTTGGKLGGPHAGTKYMVTNPGVAGTSDATVHNLFSPFFDFSSTSSATMSFYLSISTEPNWDRAIMEYSIDTGKTYQQLGTLNDAAGINWYATSVYQNAQGSGGILIPTPDCWDQATALAKSFPGDGSGANPPAAWSANGDCEVDGPAANPNGYVLVALTLDGMPMMGKSYVRFRMSYFTDAGTHGDGVAIDDFQIGAAPTSSHADFTGKVYNDVNGDGSYDGGDVALSGVSVDLTYFGTVVQTTTTNGTGDYTFLEPSAMYLPGVYDITTDYTGGAVLEDAAGVNYLGDGTDVSGQNQGYFTGSVAGMKFNDVNDNGANDSEAGLAGWTIEIHQDSLAGAFVTSAVTDGSGNYSVQLVPGTYVVSEVAQPTAGRQTYPSGDGTTTITVAAPGNTASSVYTGADFGNWLYAKVRVNLTVDINGDGLVGGGDVLPLPAIVGTTSDFIFKKDGAPVDTFTLGNGVASILYSGLDVGTYTVEELSFTPSWIRTKGGVFTKVVLASGGNDTARYMDFKMLTITGRKFNDVNGNGVDDAEAGLSGWTVSVSGAGLGSMSAVTDGSGNYSIDSVTTGLHNITETLQSGWTMTFPASPYSFTAVSGNLTNPVTGRDFGNFQNYAISGTKYRDRNNDGTMDAEDEGLSGWTINLNPGALSTVTDANGDYSFTNVGPGTKTLSETSQPGWTLSAPVGGTYTIPGASGTNVTDQDFGNFKATDSTAYRTFTLAQLQADNQKKPIAYKVGKPILAGPNTANLLKAMFLQGAVIKVGLAGQLNAGGKEKAYIQPAKYTDVWKGLNAKSVYHTGVARGLDLDVKGKLLLKRYKALPPTKKNNALIGNLVALQVNLAASGLKTPVGLGGLMYSDAGHPFNGWSIDSIANYADGVMTNWEGQPYGVYLMLDSVAAKINAAFAAPTVDDTTTGGGFTSAKLEWKAYTTVIDVPFLKATGNQAKNRIVPPTVEQLPAEFALSQNYPNPFNPTTTIQFDLPAQSMVTLKIYNMLGQEIATLLNREDVDAGQQELEFDASSLSSGVYLYRIVAESVTEEGAVSQTYTQVKKMVLLK